MPKEHPDQKVRIVGSWSKGHHAVLPVAGETSVMRFAGEAVMLNEGLARRRRADGRRAAATLQRRRASPPSLARAQPGSLPTTASRSTFRLAKRWRYSAGVIPVCRLNSARKNAASW